MASLLRIISNLFPPSSPGHFLLSRFIFCLSDRFAVTHCVFNLHFSNVYRRQTLFLMLTCHLEILSQYLILWIWCILQSDGFYCWVARVLSLCEVCGLQTFLPTSKSLPHRALSLLQTGTFSLSMGSEAPVFYIVRPSLRASSKSALPRSRSLRFPPTSFL